MSIMGILGFSYNPIFGVILISIGIFVSQSRNGIELNPEQKTYRIYTKFLGLKFGKWHSYEKYPHLSILKRSISTTVYSRAHVAVTTSRNIYYDIFLLSANHRVKLMIQRSFDRETAKKSARHLALQLGVDFVAFNPTISAQTQARHYFRKKQK